MMEISITLISGGLILALLWLVKVKNSRKYRLPPGPTALPLIGNLPQLDRSVPFKSLVKLSKTYGPVMTLYLGLRRVVVLVGYDAVKEALVDQGDDFTGRGPLPFLLKVTKGYGKRACVGESLARMELFIFLVSLLQHFTFSCAEGPDSINLISESSSFGSVPHCDQMIATPR